MATKNIPQIRFKGFDGEWKEKKFNDRFLGFTEKTTSENEDVLLSSSINGMFLNSELFSHQRGSSNKGYLKIKLGTMILSAQNLHLGNANVNLRFNHGIISPAYKTYNILEDNIAYVNAWLKRDNTNKMFFDCTTVGASLCRRNIDWDELYNQYISFPPKSEQERIASLFTTLDKQISCSEAKLDKLRAIKKTLLKKMFASTGEKTPKIRFKGFDGEWEEKPLNNWIEPSKEKNIDNKYTKMDVLSVSGDYGVVNQIEFQGRSFAGVSVSNYGVLHTNDIVYTKSPLKANPYGIIKTNLGKTGIVSTLYAIYKSKQNLNPIFVQEYFELDNRLNLYLRPLVRKGAKNDMKVSSEDAIKGMVIFPEEKEQSKISMLLLTLDKQISLQEQKIEKLKAVKKTLLKKMFV